MRLHRLTTLLLTLLALGAVTALASAQEVKSESAGAPERVLSVENEFIRLRVNTGPSEAGRFAVDTTGGDPSRSADNDQVLIYGSREPWTSYTTLNIDGAPVVFGGPTERRAGSSAPASNLTAPPRKTDNTIAATALLGDIEVTQTLGFARSPTTRVKDAALISYTIRNRGSREHTVGLRLVLDTMLGTNDGAPLRAGERAIDTATQLVGSDLPEYWQAFDSLATPAVISQGTLTAPGLSPPNRLEMVDWGTLADNPWAFPFPAGADFTRRGEEAQDTAVALYWDPVALAPGQSRTYATLYGVGGVSLSPAELSLGLTAPAEVDYRYDEQRPFSVVAYVENSGGFESRGTQLALTLSEGLALAEGSPTVQLGTLAPGKTRQNVWRLVPTGAATGTLQIVATVTSANLEPNRVARDITVISPPQLVINLTAPDALSVTPENRYSPNPFEVKATITNKGGQPADSLVSALDLSEGLVFDGDSSATRVRDRLAPGASVSLSWPVRALGLPTGRLPLVMLATAAGAKPAEARAAVRIPRLTPELRVHPASQTVPAQTDGQPTLVPISVKLIPAFDFTGAEITLNYDPAVIEPLYVSRGEGFVHNGRLLSPWSAGRTSPGCIAAIGGQRTGAPPLSAAEASLFTVVFLVRQPGETDITLEPTVVETVGTTSDYRVVGGHVTVQAEQSATPIY